MKNYEKITTLLLGLISVCLILMALAISGTIESNYTIRGEIVQIHNDIVTIEDTAGHLWDVYRDNEHYTDLAMGQTVKVKYFTNFTNRRQDDTILEIKVIN